MHWSHHLWNILCFPIFWHTFLPKWHLSGWLILPRISLAIEPWFHSPWLWLPFFLVLWHLAFFGNSTYAYRLTLLYTALPFWSHTRLPTQSHTHPHSPYSALTSLAGVYPECRSSTQCPFQGASNPCVPQQTPCFLGICLTLPPRSLDWGALLLEMKAQNSPWSLPQMTSRTSQVHLLWLHSLAIPLECKQYLLLQCLLDPGG